MGSLKLLKNWFFEDAVSVSASSEDSNFPASNLSKYIRGKVWRSSGTFVIDSSNNKLDFDDGGGEENVTLDSGTYTASELAAEIKSKMEAATGDTITVTFSTSTGKWTIASDGGTLSLLWNSGTNNANSVAESIGFDSSADDTGAVTYTGDNIAIHTEEGVVLDLQAADIVNAVAIVFDPFVGSKLSSSAVVTLQGNSTNSWAAPTMSQALTYDSTYGVFTHFFSSNQTYRYFRIKIVDPANANLYVELGKVILSNAVELTQAPEIGWAHRASDLSRIAKNPYGHYYSDDYPIARAMEFNHAAISPADHETLWQFWKDVGNTRPFGIAVDPDAALWDKDRFFMYGKFASGWSAANVFYSYFDVPTSFEEVM